MSNVSKLELLKTYIRSNVSPVLFENVSASLFENATVISSNIDITELNGHYEETDFVPPKWFSDLINKKSKFLVIDKLSQISKSDQKKFIEILKYRKVSVFELPSDLVIVITSDKLNNNIDEEILSLVAVI